MTVNSADLIKILPTFVEHFKAPIPIPVYYETSKVWKNRLWILLGVLKLSSNKIIFLIFYLDTVKKNGRGLEHIRTNLRFFRLSLGFYSSF